MNMLKEEIILLCEDFIKVVNNLYGKGAITEDQYNKMTKFKLEYINRAKNFEY